MTKLGDVTVLYTGTGFPKDLQGKKSGRYPFYKVGDISKNVLNGYRRLALCDNYLEDEDVGKIKGCILPKDTVVFAKIGEAVKLNRRAITTQDCLVDNNVMGIAPVKSVIDIDYLYYYMCSIKLDKFAEATTVPSVKKALVEKLKINLPDLVKQKKIVKVISRVDDLIQLNKKQLIDLDVLIKSRFIEMFGDPIVNPKGWSQEKLVKRCNIITGNTPSRTNSHYYGDYIEWIKSDNITGNLILTKASEFLSEEGLNVGRSVDKDSILMTCIAGSLKSIGNVAIANRKVAFNQQINAIVTNKEETYFMYEQFKLAKTYLTSDINMSLKGILNKSQLGNKKFIFPPLVLQKEFEIFFAQVDKSKLAVQKSLDELETLKKSLMQQYFG